MEEQPAQTSSFMTPPPKPSQKKWFILLFLFIIVAASAAGLLLSQKTKPQPERKSQPPILVTPNPTTAQNQPAKQTTWKLNSPVDHTFVAPDNSFRFTYPAGWSYETIDGTIPQQQHIVYLGKALTPAERQEKAQKAGVPLTDTLGGISYTTQNIIFYYTDTPSFTVTKPEELGSTILSKKEIRNLVSFLSASKEDK